MGRPVKADLGKHWLSPGLKDERELAAQRPEGRGLRAEAQAEVTKQRTFWFLQQLDSVQVGLEGRIYS